MSNAKEKRGLGRFSLAVYPVLALIFAWVCVHYDLARQAVWAKSTNGLTREQVLVEFNALRLEFFCIAGGLVLLGIIWFLVVRREKQYHPERYHRYLHVKPRKKNP